MREGASRIRILLVEDNRDDAELLSIELREAGMHVDLVRIDDEQGMHASLAEAIPDLVVSDSSLPGFSGLSALQLARELAPGTPFVFLSGGFDPVTLASGNMQTADACVLKQDLAQLPGLIRQLLAR